MFSSNLSWSHVGYWELCGESHNGMDEVLKIHSLNLGSKEIILHLLKPLEKGDQLYRCHIIAFLINNSTASLTQFGFNFDTSAIMQAYQNFIEELQKQFKGNNTPSDILEN